MLYETPSLESHHRAFAELDSLRRRLGAEVSRVTPWAGRLRREARVATARSSTAIEGYHVPDEAASALVEGRSAATGRNEKALAGYALAMQHVAVLAADPAFAWSERLLLDLHFETCSSEPDSEPGRWRTGQVVVTAPGGGVAYRAPEAPRVTGLTKELVRWLSTGDVDAPVAIRAAMAHLHLVSIHPFRDGNGRLSRILQSLVLARDGVLVPELGSIEEFLARNTLRYYEILRDVQGGSYQPERSASAWIEFCIEAHLTQARERLDTIHRAAHRWATIEALVEDRGWPDRLAIALEQSLFDGADRAAYSAEAAISPATASADFRRIHDAGLVERRGRGRSTRYVATEELRTRVSESGDA